MIEMAGAENEAIGRCGEELEKTLRNFILDILLIFGMLHNCWL